MREISASATFAGQRCRPLVLASHIGEKRSNMKSTGQHLGYYRIQSPWWAAYLGQIRSE